MAPVGHLGEGERVGSHQCVVRAGHGRGAQHRLHVIVGQRVSGVERERPLEGADGLGPGRRLVGPRGVVEPRLAQSVPRVGVRRVPGEELLVGGTGIDEFNAAVDDVIETADKSSAV